MVSEVLTVLLQVVVLILITTAGVLIKKYLVPWVKSQLEKNNIKITQDQWDMAVSIITTLVQSASRLKLSGKLEGEDAKNYVLSLAKDQLGDLGIELDDKMIDDIRRAAVIEWEKAMKEADNTTLVIKDTIETADEDTGDVGSEVEDSDTAAVE